MDKEELIKTLKNKIEKAKETKDDITVTGKATVKEEDPETGEVVSKETFSNVLVQDGAQKVAKYVNGDAPTDIEWMAVGNGATAGNSPTGTESSLQTEQARSSSITSSVSGETVSWSNTFSAGTGTNDLSEMGMFDASGASSGTMLSYVIFSSTKDNANNDLTIEYDLTFNYG